MWFGVFSLWIFLQQVTVSLVPERLPVSTEAFSVLKFAAPKEAVPALELIPRTGKEEQGTNSDRDLSRRLENLSFQFELVNTDQVDTLTIDHQKSLLYQLLQKLPKNQRQALQFLSLKEEKNETRGLGGGGTLILSSSGLPDAELVSVFTHEMGHVVDTGMLQGKGFAAGAFQDGEKPVLLDDLSNTFYSISWVSNTQRQRGEAASRLAFVSGYARNDPFEDFAESYTMYVLHGKTFRSLLPSSTYLRQKYNFLKDMIFHGEEFQTGTETDSAYDRVYDTTLLPIDLTETLK